MGQEAHTGYTDSGKSGAAFRSRPKAHQETGSEIIAAVASIDRQPPAWVEAHLLRATGLAPATAFVAIYSLLYLPGRQNPEVRRNQCAQPHTRLLFDGEALSRVLPEEQLHAWHVSHPCRP